MKRKKAAAEGESPSVIRELSLRTRKELISATTSARSTNSYTKTKGSSRSNAPRPETTKASEEAEVAVAEEKAEKAVEAEAETVVEEEEVKVVEAVAASLAMKRRLSLSTKRK